MNFIYTTNIAILIILFSKIPIAETRSGKHFIMAGEEPGFRAISVNGLVFISGQQGILPKESEEEEEEEEEEGDKSADKEDDSKPSPSPSPAPEANERRKRECEADSDSTTALGEAEIAMKNIVLLVEEAGGTVDDILLVRIYMVNLGEYPELQALYRKIFSNYPALTLVEVPKLTNDAKVTIEAIAVLDST